jgi:hypothetical protein
LYYYRVDITEQSRMGRMLYNGPAIWGGCVTRRKHPGRVLVPRVLGDRKLSRCKPAWLRSQTGRVWRTFCRHGTNFIEHYECRDTRLIGATNLSPVTKLVAATGAVSQYKLSRSQKFITVQELYCVQMRVSGCKNHYKFVLSVGASAKSVTTCPA